MQEKYKYDEIKSYFDEWIKEQQASKNNKYSD